MTGCLFAMLPGYGPTLRVGIAQVALVAVIFARTGYERRRGPSRLRLVMMALICGPIFGVLMGWLLGDGPGLTWEAYCGFGMIGAFAGSIAAFAFWVDSPSPFSASKHQSSPAGVYDRHLDDGP